MKANKRLTIAFALCLCISASWGDDQRQHPERANPWGEIIEAVERDGIRVLDLDVAIVNRRMGTNYTAAAIARSRTLRRWVLINWLIDAGVGQGWDPAVAVNAWLKRYKA